MILSAGERLLSSAAAEQKTSEINWSGQKLEDKLKQDGFPSFSGENRSAALNAAELLTWVKWSYCLEQRCGSKTRIRSLKLGSNGSKRTRSEEAAKEDELRSCGRTSNHL